MEQQRGFHAGVRRIDVLRAVVALQGEMDTYTAQRAKTILVSLLDDGCIHQIINLQGLSFIDSTGLGVLVGSLRRAREVGGSLRLVAPPPHIRRLIEITRLTLAFPIDATDEEALRQTLQEEEFGTVGA